MTPSDRAPDRVDDDCRTGFIGVVEELAAGAGEEGLTIGQILDRMDERAFGLMILVLAIPCLVPAVQGVPQVVALPMLLLAGQILIGREEPWLPGAILRRRVSKAWLTRMADFARKSMGWFEQMSRPRLRFLATGLGEKLAAAMICVGVVCILPPITNTVPSLGITLLCVGLLQRDGLFVAGGTAVVGGWAAAMGAVLVGLMFGAQWAVDLLARFGISI